MLKMKDEMEAMRQTSEEALLDNLNIRKEFEAQRVTSYNNMNSYNTILHILHNITH